MDPFGHLLKLLKSSISPQEGTVVSPYSTEPRGTIRINKDDLLNKQFSLFLVFFLAFFFCFSFFFAETPNWFSFYLSESGLQESPPRKLIQGMLKSKYEPDLSILATPPFRAGNYEIVVSTLKQS